MSILLHLVSLKEFTYHRSCSLYSLIVYQAFFPIARFYVLLVILIYESSLDDCILLQSDFDRFTEWFNLLGLTLNVSISCSNDYVTDLGFILSSNLDPRPHIEHICCKAFKTLGFVMRLCRDFRLGLSYKVLYCALVRPIVEYGAVIWDPHDLNDSLRLERVQRKFLMYASFRLNIPCEPHNYGPIASHLGLVSLAERRRISGIKYS